MRWIGVILLASVGLAAQTQPRKKAAPAKRAPAVQARRDWPIQSLSVAGNRDFPAEKILQASGLKTGQTADKEAFEAARERLLATGFFASVGYRYEPSGDGKGYAATLEVVEVGPLYPFRIEDLPAPAAELEAVLRRADPLFGPRIPATEPVLKRYAQALESHLASAGKKEAVVGRLAADAPDNLVVVFRPAAPPPVIAFVKFTGCAVLPAVTLQNAMAGVAVGVPYSEGRVRQLLDTAIRPLYEARGRLRVAFPKMAAAPASDVKGLIVTVSVEEGASYNLGEVRVEGAPASPESLLKAANLKADDIANFQEVEAGRQRMLKLLRRNGYMRAEARVERNVDDKRKVVDVVFHFTAGPQYVFGKLAIQGLDILSEPQVRKLWALQEGKPFDGDYPDYFLARVREDGVFDNLGSTRASTSVDDARRVVGVTLIFGPAAPKPKREPGREP
jgi:outer membrane protein assembly factor BamA